jgi:CubicO group peptidase (beta-lactamase class C family)
MTSWQIGPWNRWAYQHTRELLPTARVARADDAVSALRTDPVELGGVWFARGDGRTTTLDRYVDASWTDGLIVLRDGVVVYEQYRNGMDSSTRHLSQSVAKSVLALVIGCSRQGASWSSRPPSRRTCPSFAAPDTPVRRSRICST